MNKKTASEKAISWTEAGLVPDKVIRAGIRRLNRRRLADIQAGNTEQQDHLLNVFVEQMNRSEIAPVPHLANKQHYEVPAEFFAEVLGPKGKYSSCFWGAGASNLAQAEEDALEITCRRARIEAR